MARYSLWAKNKIDPSKNFIIKLSDKDNMKLSEKVDLQVIDFYTTEFENEKAVLSNFDNIDDLNNWNLEITYQSNKRTKTLDVAYFNDVLIKNYSHNYSNNKFIPTNDPDLFLIKKFLLENSYYDAIFFRDIQNSTYMNDYIKTKIENFIYARTSSIDDQNTRNFSQRQLTEELSRYKNIRGVMFFLKRIKDRYSKYNFPVIKNKTNVEMKRYVEPTIETNNIDPDKMYKYNPPFETEFVFNDEGARNYDELPDPDLRAYDNSLSKKSNKKVYTKKLPNQSYLFDEDN